MFSPITDSHIVLRYSPEVVSEIDRIVDSNLDKVPLVALFISRLLKGIQNLSNTDQEVNSSWGIHSYEIEDIGVLEFRLFLDINTNITTIAVEQIKWSFLRSRFFSDFNY